jgi:hypothetical protein
VLSFCSVKVEAAKRPRARPASLAQFRGPYASSVASSQEREGVVVGSVSGIVDHSISRNRRLHHSPVFPSGSGPVADKWEERYIL